MWILAVTLALGALLAATPASAQFTIFRSISTDPATPVAGDTVTITASAEMQDSCSALPVPFEVTCKYVFPAAGPYTVRTVENPDTGRGGFHYD